MKYPLLFLAIAVFVLAIGGFALGQFRGRVKGLHPVEKKATWIARAEHPRHFWGYTLLHILLYIILAWVILGLWNAPAF